MALTVRPSGFNVKRQEGGLMPPEEKLLPLRPLGLMLEGLLPWNRMSLQRNGRPVRIAG